MNPSRSMNRWASSTGVPTGTLSIPSRYVHTPSQLVDLQDVEGAVKLLVALLSGDTALDV